VRASYTKEEKIGQKNYLHSENFIFTDFILLLILENVQYTLISKLFVIFQCR